MKCTSALLHCTSLINEPRIVDALLPNDSAVEPESATEQAETCGTYSLTTIYISVIAVSSKNLIRYKYTSVEVVAKSAPFSKVTRSFVSGFKTLTFQG